jgi:NitT/TauT family transport system substrate-binding protein
MTGKDINITNMDADAAGAAIVAKKVPAAVTWEPWLTKTQSSGAKVIFSSKDAPDVILDVLTISGATLQEKPADIKAFMAGCAKGAQYANDNPEEAAKVAAKYFGTSAAEAKSMMSKIKLYGVADNKRLMGTADAPGAAVKTAGEIADFFVAQKVMT